MCLKRIGKGCEIILFSFINKISIKLYLNDVF